MPDMHLDDIHNELLSDDGQLAGTVEIPEMLDSEPEDKDIDNLFDLSPDIYGDEYNASQNEPSSTGEGSPLTSQSGEADIVNDILRSKGIEDPEHIAFENEDGELEEVSFYDLSYDEQLNILNSSDADLEPTLEDHELEAISFLRENGATLEEAIQYYQRKAVEDYINNQNIAGLEVDQYDDNELFVLDLKSKYPELTDDELDLELNRQLEHPDLFRKKVEQLRTDYKEIEATQLEQSRLEQEQVDEQRRQELEDALVSTAIQVDELGGLSLDDEDRNEVLSFILEKDLNGYSSFVKSLNSPQTLFEAAWFVTKGKEAFNILHDYYKKEIANVSRTAYEKGRQSTQPQTAESASRRSYTRKGASTPSRTPPTASGSGSMSIHDLTIE